MKRFFSITGTRKCKLKPELDPTKQLWETQINSNKTKNGGEDREKVDCSYVALGNAKWYNDCGK